MVGFVSLVGAGPGDPDLLTVKAARRLGEADVVLYDALVCEALLQHAQQARWVFVGKRAGNHSMTQTEIQSLMVATAGRGQRIVRLKCGDPFVFGRGGEEALALARAGIPYEVVPGVSSSVAAPGLSGIPVTHRGLASGFVTVTGHDPDVYEPMLEGIAPRSMTLVLLMGLRRRHDIADFLMHRGWAGSTPVAVLFEASTRAAHTWRGTLDELRSKRHLGQRPSAAGTVVVGDVVRVADELAALRVEAHAAVAAV